MTLNIDSTHALIQDKQSIINQTDIIVQFHRGFIIAIITSRHIWLYKPYHDVHENLPLHRDILLNDKSTIHLYTSLCSTVTSLVNSGAYLLKHILSFETVMFLDRAEL